MSQLIIRKGSVDDVPLLEQAIAPDEDRVPFHRAETFIVETDGVPTHFAAARLVWLIEPLRELPSAHTLPKNTKRRAVHSLAKRLDEFVGSRLENRTGVHEYFCHSDDPTFIGLIKHWSLLLYPRAFWFHRKL